MKTKVEILEWLFEDYFLKHDRSVEGDRCLYAGPDGAMCAFAVCCEPDKRTKLIEHRSARDLLERYGFGLLQEELRHEEIPFWEQVQSFHDDYANWWTVEGKNFLSQSGIDYLAKLKRRFA